MLLIVAAVIGIRLGALRRGRAKASPIKTRPTSWPRSCCWPMRWGCWSRGGGGDRALAVPGPLGASHGLRCGRGAGPAR